jgi:hypothetical protein
VNPRGNLPRGGEALWKLRVAGQRPESMVLAALNGPHGVPNTQVWVGTYLPDSAIPGLEWRMLVGLDVEVVTDMSIPLPRLLIMIRTVAAHAAGLFLWYSDLGVRFVLRWGGKRLTVGLPEFEGEVTAELAAAAGAIGNRLRAELWRRGL